MYDFAKYVDGKPLKGRSIKGIQFELLVHYIVYVALCERKNLTEKEQFGQSGDGSMIDKE